MKLLDIADSSRYKCTCCNEKINKGEKYFRDAKSSGIRFSHTVNICYRCITKMYLKANVCQKEVDKIRDEIMIERIETE